MNCPKRQTYDKKHEWVAPSWLRLHVKGTTGLLLVCKHCGILAGIDDVTFETVKRLKDLFGLTINDLEFIRLERWNGGR